MFIVFIQKHWLHLSISLQHIYVGLIEQDQIFFGGRDEEFL